jgi:hypothetical protein
LSAPARSLRRGKLHRHPEIPAGRNLPRPTLSISSINRQFVNVGLVSGPIRASLQSREGYRVKWRSAPPGSPAAREHAPARRLARSLTAAQAEEGRFQLPPGWAVS